MIRRLRERWERGAEQRRLVERSRREIKRLMAADKARSRDEKLRVIV